MMDPFPKPVWRIVQKHDIPTMRYKRKFRLFVRKLVSNLYWMTDTSDVPLGNNPEFNAYILSHKRRDKQFISLADKLVLRRPPELRTEEELVSICNKLTSFKAFWTYSNKVKYDLLQKAMFLYYKPGTVLVKQGQRAMFVYYILSGTVQVEMDEEESLFTKKNVKTTYEINAGDTFGEIAVLYNEPHTLTYTVGECNGLEVLVLEAKDYRYILKSSVQKKWERVRWAMKKFSCFDQFEETTLRFFCCRGETAIYRPNSIIPVQDSLNRDITTFIIDGSCKVIQKINVTRCSSPSNIGYYLENNQDSEKSRHVKGVYMQTCLLRRGAVFGLGENLSKHPIITVTNVLILVIPRYILMKYNISKIWTQSAFNMDIWYPSEEEIFKNFVQGRNWLLYKKKLLNSIRDGRKTTNMTIHDTPLSVRAREMIVSDYFPMKRACKPEYLATLEPSYEERYIEKKSATDFLFYIRNKGFWEEKEAKNK